MSHDNVNIGDHLQKALHLHGAKLDKDTHKESIDHKINATIEGNKNDLDLKTSDPSHERIVRKHPTKHVNGATNNDAARTAGTVQRHNVGGTAEVTHHGAANPDSKVPLTFTPKENYPATFQDLLAKHNTDVPKNPFGTHPNQDLPTTTFHGKTGVPQKDVDNYYEHLKKASGDSYTKATSAFNDKIHTAVESHPNILGPKSMSDIVEDRNELARRAAKDKTNT